MAVFSPKNEGNNGNKKFFNEFLSFSSSSQQPNFITSLGQTPMIQPIIPLVTTPLQPTPPAPQEQEQEQKKKNIDPGLLLILNYFWLQPSR